MKKRKQQEDRQELLSKAVFLQQYILNRAATSDFLDGEAAAQQAIKAWDVIDKELTLLPPDK